MEAITESRSTAPLVAALDPGGWGISWAEAAEGVSSVISPVLPAGCPNWIPETSFCLTYNHRVGRNPDSPETRTRPRSRTMRSPPEAPRLRGTGSGSLTL